MKRSSYKVYIIIYITIHNTQREIQPDEHYIYQMYKMVYYAWVYLATIESKPIIILHKRKFN